MDAKVKKMENKLLTELYDRVSEVLFDCQEQLGIKSGDTWYDFDDELDSLVEKCLLILDDQMANA